MNKSSILVVAGLAGILGLTGGFFIGRNTAFAPGISDVAKKLSSVDLRKIEKDVRLREAFERNIYEKAACVAAFYGELVRGPYNSLYGTEVYERDGLRIELDGISPLNDQPAWRLGPNPRADWESVEIFRVGKPVFDGFVQSRYLSYRGGGFVLGVRNSERPPSIDVLVIGNYDPGDWEQKLEELFESIDD
ncbi:MAG: hypothetical protein Q8P57_03890 [Candidatus Pacearchaeota archaeon]|nr:hypothetical protein [Candidatus Pacearchaeota archaeon]